MKYILGIVLVFILLIVCGALNDALNNPIITFFTFGLYVQAKFAGWGFGDLGWLLCFIIELGVALLVIGAVSWIYSKFKKSIKGFGG